MTDIPNFDPTQLPFWDIYEREKTAATIQVGGTLGGEFTAGLSGGQRKLLLFELIYQRTISSELHPPPDDKIKEKNSQPGQLQLIVLDEPFAGALQPQHDDTDKDKQLREPQWIV